MPNTSPKVCIIVQARMGSERLPGKVMKRVLDKTLLEHQLERLARVRLAEQVIVATTTAPKDEVISNLCQWLSVAVHRGPEEDVLARFYEAAKKAEAGAVVRVCADSPLIDPAVVDRVIAYYLEHLSDVDYVSNTLDVPQLNFRRTFPRGMDCEIFSMRALEEAFFESAERREREHVTPFIYSRPDRYRLFSFECGESLSRYRLTVDTPEDLLLIEKILKALYPAKPLFDLDDVVRVLSENPEWPKINAHVQQKPLTMGEK